MNQTALTIGILVAAIPRPSLAAKFGDYPYMFTHLLNAANDEPGSVAFRTYDILKGDFPKCPSECAGYILTGSQASVFDELPWISQTADFVLELHERCHKLVGICFGHQMIAHVLDGHTERSECGWGVGVHEYNITQHLSCMEPNANRLRVHCSHQDQVTMAPSEANIFAESDFCPIAGMSLGDHFFSIQGHPEFTAGYAKGLLETRRASLGDTYREGMATMDRETDRLLFAKWMLKFLRETGTGRFTPTKTA